MALISNKKEPNHIAGSAKVYDGTAFGNVTNIGDFVNGTGTSMQLVVSPFTTLTIKVWKSGAVS